MSKRPKIDPNSPEYKTEEKTLRVMIGIYCKGHHEPDGDFCCECQELYDYAMRRLECCTFGSEKPRCSKCPIHCYKPEMREKIKQVMGYAGPRMIGKHPILAIKHMMRPSLPDRGEKT